MLLENHDSYFTRPDKAAADPTTPFDSEGVESQVEVVHNATLARNVIDRLGLAKTAEYSSSLSDGLLGALFGDRGGGNSQDRLVETFLNKLNVFAVTKTRVLQIEFTSADPSLAARGANEVASLYLDQQEAAKARDAKAAASWLSDKIDELRRKVAETDSKAEALRASAGLLTGANGLTVPTQQLAEINSQIANARAQQSAAAAKAQLLRDMLRSGRLDTVPDVAKDESLRRYAELRVSLKAQIAEQSRTLLPNHPHMKELAGQLAGLDQEIQDAAQKAVRGLEDEAQLAGTQVKQLQAAINSSGSCGRLERSPSRCSCARSNSKSKSLRDQLEILSRQISRGHGARRRQRDASECARHRARARSLVRPASPRKSRRFCSAGWRDCFFPPAR